MGVEYTAQIIKILKKKYPDAKIALNFGNLFQLLVAVVLSAQCTDVRVNKITPALFRRFPDVRAFSMAKIGDLEKMIYSTGFYKNKAKNIKAAAEKIVKDFGEKLPDNMKNLLSLPGIARKSANVILETGFGKVEGITVDTHVCRVSGMLGLVDKKLSKSKNALKIEQILMEKVPRVDWGIFPHLLIFHGRQICVARRPKCEICPLNKICPSASA
ncbi:endonuclease III [Candidatus Peregrinibacteria bacterium RIFCSPLOWO2_01_FULL_39_12]|nr:MAG: endonuclease III [Candidatus Peregrinibacteria bacterium RIFCSPLOWO2_01_FULL_39_12]OGJ42688.1 MAG: endonuclease III [Candidatus Peregrinibacteria bacterium RIFCSPLOWO2_02_FULL_39_10]